MGKDEKCGECDGTCGQADESCAQAQIEELTSTLKYLQADYENYRKRVERDKAEFSVSACRIVIEKILPVLDTFELAIKSSPKDDPAVKGFELVYAQLIGVLGEFRLTPVEAVGKFNPMLHEALLSEESDKAPGEIIEELQKGYMLGEKVIRPAKVKISK